MECWMVRLQRPVELEREFSLRKVNSGWATCGTLYYRAKNFPIVFTPSLQSSFPLVMIKVSLSLVRSSHCLPSLWNRMTVTPFLRNRILTQELALFVDVKKEATFLAPQRHEDPLTITYFGTGAWRLKLPLCRVLLTLISLFRDGNKPLRAAIRLQPSLLCC